jgi:transcriptional regulator with XRE-family HTH domain
LANNDSARAFATKLAKVYDGIEDSKPSEAFAQKKSGRNPCVQNSVSHANYIRRVFALSKEGLLAGRLYALRYNTFRIYLMISIQDQLRQSRETKGFTQADMGARIGQPQSAVSRIERGGDLRVSTLLEMARVLEMEPVLVPKILIPAVQALLGHATGQRDTKTSGADSIPLVGGAPEDAEDNQ